MLVYRGAAAAAAAACGKPRADASADARSRWAAAQQSRDETNDARRPTTASVIERLGNAQTSTCHAFALLCSIHPPTAMNSSYSASPTTFIVWIAGKSRMARVEVRDEGEEAPAAAGAKEEQYFDANFDWIANEKLRNGAKYVYPVAYKVYVVMDWIGEKVAYALGATQSRFQYAVDEYHRQERRNARKAELERQRMLEKARRQGIAGGDAGDDRDGSCPYVPPVITTEVVRPAPGGLTHSSSI